jgi:hypothetical protein
MKSLRPLASRRPSAEELAPPHQTYLNAVAGDDALVVLHKQLEDLCQLAGMLSTDQVDRIEPPYGWTIRQVIEHCLVAERVFGYRCMRIAAGDTTPLPGFDENFYADARFGLGGGATSMMEELGLLRRSLLLMLHRFEPAAWDRVTEVAGCCVTMRAVAWVAAGHLAHHLAIMRRRLAR